MSDEEAHRKKEAEKAKVETWGQTQKVIEKEMSDEEARHKREAEKAKEDKVETWSQTQKVSKKEMSDKEARREKEAEKAKEDKVETWSQTQTKLPPPEVAKKRPGSPLQSNQSPFGLKPRKRAYCKGKYQQIKPVLRYPCDACKHVSKTTDQLKKHMIIAHNGHKNTTWMFCGDCEYATRVEEELVNHVKHHQLFSILGDDKDDDVPIDDDEDDETPVSKTGLGNYDPKPMNCGDCPFETHYENEIFEHLKMHLEMSDEEARRKKEAEKAKVETWGQTQKVIKKEMSDEEARRKKEAEKAKEGVETWGQTQKVIEKEMSDEEARRKKEAEKAKEDEERLEEKEKETEAEKAKKETKKEKVRKVNHSESSDEGCTKFTLQARTEVPMPEKGYMSEKNMGMTLLQSLMNEDNRGGIKEQAWKKLGKVKLVCKDGVTNLFQFLDKKLLKTIFVRCIELNDKHKAVKHQEEWSINKYIAEAQQNWEQIADMGYSVPAPVKCATLIRGLNLTETQVHLITSRLSIRAVDLEGQTVEAIKAFTDTNRVLTKADKPKKTKEEENVNIAEDALGEGADKSYAEWKKAQKEKEDRNGEKGATFFTQATSSDVNAIQLFDKNRMDGGAYDSYITSCLCLYEYDRYVTTTNNETDRKGRERVDQFTYENHRQAGRMKAQAIEKNPVQSKTLVQAVTMFKGMDAQGSGKSELLVSEENVGMAILDTGCAGSAAGREWVEDHIENLCPEDKLAVRRMEGTTYFKFGSGKRYKSQQRLVLPVYIGERRAMMAVDMVEVKIPLLISLPAMKKAKTVINTATDTANIFGQNIKLVRSDGHYTLSLRKGGAKTVTEESMDGRENRENLGTEEEDLENLMVKVLAEPGSWKKEVTKAHSQMCHVSAKRIKPNLEGGSTMRHARHEDCIRVREEDEQELEREAEMVNQESNKQDEKAPLRKEDEITMPGIAEEEPIAEQEWDDGVEIQEENGGVELRVLTRERVGGNSIGDAGVGIAKTNPADNAETNPADGVVVFIDTAEGIMPNTERVIKQAGCFASSQYRACFTLKSLAQLYSDTYEEINVPEFARSLGGDIYLNSKTRKLAKKSPHGSTQKSPVEFILEPRYKPSAQVVGDVDKSLPMLCEQLGIRLTKDEMKLSIRSLLKIVCSGLLGDLNGFTSMCEEHIPSPVENAKQKAGETSETERYEDMVGDDQDGRLMVHTTKQYPTEDTTCFHVLGRVMNGTLHAGKEVDSRNMRVGRLWVYEARNKVKVNRVLAGNWIMIEGIDQPIVKTSTFTDMQGEEEGRKMFMVGSKEDTDFVHVGWHMKQNRHSTTVSQDNYIKKVVFETQWEPYVETTCYMQNKESCMKKPTNNWTRVIETNIERVCFDVNELDGDLVEAIHYEKLEETYQVQWCVTGKNKVCDTTYKTDMTTKDDYQCTNAETPNCYMEEKAINDVTCTSSVELNCKRDKSTKNEGYGAKGVVYDRKPTQSYYNIPRKTQVEVCKTDMHRYCEKFSNIFPFPVKKQNCHFEPKKCCELEMKTRPKKTKKYSYIKDCKEQPREICDQCDIQPLCDTQERMVRTYETNRKRGNNKSGTELRKLEPMLDYATKFSNSFPLRAKEQICRFEPKKIYELEMKTRPKKTKKDSYIKDCKEQPREICDQCDIQPLCDTQERMVRTYETNRKRGNNKSGTELRKLEPMLDFATK